MNLATAHRIPTMASTAIAKVRDLEKALADLPPCEIVTDHVLHGGLYARTIKIPAGVMLTGVVIKIPTTLIFEGHALVFVGADAPLELAGYRVLPASAGRKQAFLAMADTNLTMVFPTAAKTIEEAEDEFTDEGDQLFSRLDPSLNNITITGE